MCQTREVPIFARDPSKISHLLKKGGGRGPVWPSPFSYGSFPFTHDTPQRPSFSSSTRPGSILPPSLGRLIFLMPRTLELPHHPPVTTTWSLTSQLKSLLLIPLKSGFSCYFQSQHPVCFLHGLTLITSPVSSSKMAVNILLNILSSVKLNTWTQKTIYWAPGWLSICQITSHMKGLM